MILTYMFYLFIQETEVMWETLRRKKPELREKKDLLEQNTPAVKPLLYDAQIRANDLYDQAERLNR